MSEKVNPFSCTELGKLLEARRTNDIDFLKRWSKGATKAYESRVGSLLERLQRAYKPNGEKKTITRLETVIFYRTERNHEKGIREIGIELNEGDLGIIDVHGNHVYDVWTVMPLSRIVIQTDLAKLQEQVNRPLDSGLVML